ncbi:MAG: radical SAM protein [Planctomycetota bacterium]|jgi:hypothetical protein
MAGKADYSIPPLIDGGLMFSYRCSNACRHCLYRCSPKKPNDWITMETAKRALAALAREPRLESIHLSGGEAALRMDLLCDITRLAREMGVRLSYLETNASWCTSPEKTEERFRQMREAGLPGVLVSVSMFHNEFVPFARTRNAVEAAVRVFGRHNVFVWLPHLYEALERNPEPDRTHSLEEFCERAGLTDRWDLLPRLYSLIPGGRVPAALRQCYQPQSAAAFRTVRCLGQLTSTSHFHIDPYGNLFTGLCAGIVAADVDNLHPEISESTHPVFSTLCSGGPYGLMQQVVEEFGYEEKPEGYISECDLCLDVRTFMRSRKKFNELEPEAFYMD